MSHRDSFVTPVLVVWRWPALHVLTTHRVVCGFCWRHGTGHTLGKQQMAREVASRVLEEDTSCLVWKTSQGVRVAVCWQAAGGPIEGVAFGVEEGEAEGRVSGQGPGGVLEGVILRVADGLVTMVTAEAIQRTGREVAWGEEAKRVMQQRAREVASRVLEEGTQCLLWETSLGITVGVCRQQAGGWQRE